jgi:hypothetical protein
MDFSAFKWVIHSLDVSIWEFAFVKLVINSSDLSFSSISVVSFIKILEESILYIFKVHLLSFLHVIFIFKLDDHLRSLHIFWHVILIHVLWFDLFKLKVVQIFLRYLWELGLWDHDIIYPWWHLLLNQIHTGLDFFDRGLFHWELIFSLLTTRTGWLLLSKHFWEGIIVLLNRSFYWFIELLLTNHSF